MSSASNATLVTAAVVPAIGVAKQLQKAHVPVEAMVLFDPVDRSPTSFADEIPTNVQTVVQAGRIPDTFSRVSFNNCGNTFRFPTRGETKHFWATHGGIGGVPWKPGPDDRSTDFVSEGFSELILIGETYFALGIPWNAEPGDRRTELQFLMQRAETGNHTRVTYQQDAEGSHAVWLWIEPWLRKLGFLG